MNLFKILVLFLLSPYIPFLPKNSPSQNIPKDYMDGEETDYIVGMYSLGILLQCIFEQNLLTHVKMTKSKVVYSTFYYGYYGKSLSWLVSAIFSFRPDAMFCTIHKII